MAAKPKGSAARAQLRKELVAIAHHGEISEEEFQALGSKPKPQPGRAKALAAKPRKPAAKTRQPKRAVRGRPRKDEHGEKEELIALLKEGVTFRRACAAVGIALRTMWDWHDQDDVFRASLARAREAGYKARIDEALDRAQAATDKDMAYCARVVADIALKTLELHQRSQQLQVNLTGGTGGPVSITWAIAGAAGGETQSAQIVIEGKADAAG